ncbi:MAG TPA: TatD family hydrolase [Oscillospiraceae bacterium]|nr:TatD family hydrolase [Oscillospiraceae bacterium]
MYFDTHAHYDDEAFDADRDALLASLPAAGIDLVVNPGSDLVSSRKAAALARRFPHVYAAVGCHPHEAKDMQKSDLGAFAALAAEKKVVAIGEIGLDYFYDHSPREIQRARLREQMALADDLRLPVIIHDREAHADCLEIVKEFPRVRGVYHCYSGSLEYAKSLVALGWYLGFTGAVTFKNARKALETLAWLPEDRFFLETDAPYLAPVPHRGERCDSRMLPLTAAKVAEARGAPVEAVAAQAARNGRAFFGIGTED